MKAFAETLTIARKEWFGDEYGTKQLHLRILGTHPDYQRRVLQHNTAHGV